jgi:hypothetical protein
MSNGAIPTRRDNWRVDTIGALPRDDGGGTRVVPYPEMPYHIMSNGAGPTRRDDDASRRGDDGVTTVLVEEGHHAVPQSVMCNVT